MAPFAGMFVSESFAVENQMKFAIGSLSALRHIPARTSSFSLFHLSNKKKRHHPDDGYIKRGILGPPYINHILLLF
jgi:hypothetical protein